MMRNGDKLFGLNMSIKLKLQMQYLPKLNYLLYILLKS